MEQPSWSFLAEPAELHDFYWSPAGYTQQTEVWNTLGGENAISAAVSAPDEEKERVKSVANTAFVLEHTKPDTVVLDLGCGYGRLAKYVLPLRTYAAWIGLDSSRVMLDIFHRRHATNEAEAKTPAIMVQSHIDQLPIRDHSVDYCVVSAVFLHNPKTYTERSIAEIHRVLKPGGALLVIESFPFSRTLTGLMGNAYLAYLKLTGKAQKNGPVRYFHEKEVRRMLQKFSYVTIYRNGFTVVPKTITGLPEFIQKPYRRFISAPINTFLEKHLPASIRKHLCTHLDVVATA
ncbi:MAG: class I SAM-dependent methyltransferase [Patescibacteria group bacterium]